MKKKASIIKTALRTIIWIIISLIIIIISTGLLLRIPSIQTKIADYAGSYISNKTKTKADIERISISFFKSVAVEGIFLEDNNGDSLLYLGLIKVNISFKDLLRKELHVNSLQLDDAIITLNRSEADSLFNYNFLIKAFSDTTQLTEPDEGKKSEWNVSVDNIDIETIKIQFLDDYEGLNAVAVLNNLHLKMNELDLENSKYYIDTLNVEGLNTNVLVNKFTESKENQSESTSPVIIANSILLNNIQLSYDDSVNNQIVLSDIKSLVINDISADLENQILNLNEIFLSESGFQFRTIDNSSSAPVSDTLSENSNWVISADKISLNDNSIAYHVGNKQHLENRFDINHVELKNIMLEVRDLFYSSAKAELSVNLFTLKDQNNFSITKFETVFQMNQQTIAAENLKLLTSQSSIDADLIINFPSIESLKDSIQMMALNLDIRNLSIRNSDVTYFNPDLKEIAFLNEADNQTTVSGLIHGPINNLKGENLEIATGDQTILKTDFLIAGLPEVKTAYFNITDFEINSGREDIMMLGGSVIPETIILPRDISLKAFFRGTMRSFRSDVSIKSTYGSASLNASLDTKEYFEGRMDITDFDLGSLLNNESMGMLSLVAEVDGSGRNLDAINANLKVEIPYIHLNNYTFQNLSLDGILTGRNFEGDINLDDENVAFDLNAMLNLNPDQEQYKFSFILHGADLQKLNLTKEDIRVAFAVATDISGSSLNTINGNAGITNIVVVHDGENYVLDSMSLAMVNEPGNSEFRFSSPLIDIKYNGTISPEELLKVPVNFINNYFPVSDSIAVPASTGESQNFNFEIVLYDNPVLRQVFLPKLIEFLPGRITGSFDTDENALRFNAEIARVIYGTTEIRDFTIDISSDESALDYRIFSNSISSPQINLENFMIEGDLAENKITLALSSISEDDYIKLQLGTVVTKENDGYRIILDPEMFLMNDPWNISTDNFIHLGNKGFLIHDLSVSNLDSEISISSLNNDYNDDLSIVINNFSLDDVFGIIQRDSALVKGLVNGNILLKRVNDAYGIVADASVNKLSVGEVSVGNIFIKAENPVSERFDIEVQLSGGENELTVGGYLFTKAGENAIDIKASIGSLSLETVELFSMGAITESSGNMSGELLITGNTDTPLVNGKLIFKNAFITPAALNNRLNLVEETIQLQDDGIYFDSFEILDSKQNMATIDGAVRMDNFKDFVFDLKVSANNFLLFNTTQKDNETFYGRLIIDSQLEISGPLELPVVNARLKMKENSYFTFAVTERELTADRGEDVVEFEGLSSRSPILDGDKKRSETILTGFDIASVIEVDKQATLRVLLDPSTNDSLVVRGDAALSFAIDPSGKMSLTGTYNILEGSYLVSLESLIKRQFDIKSGSTITWNGDPLDAVVSIDAGYAVRAAPIDLVADQMAGLSEDDRNTYTQRYPFEVLLKLRGAILNPEISFEIQLAQEDKGILGGSVNAKLNMLIEDPSTLNKQVFALLILGRFIQENPFQTDAATSAVRSTVGRFLSDQLNQWSSRLVPGVELNFDIQSYNEYQSGEAEGRTQLDVGVKKQLFNERLSVQVEGVVDVEGEEARQNSANDITSNVTIEYKLTEDGRFRLKGFRHNKYEGAIEGQIVETGAGIMYVRDFNRWKEFFRKRNE